MKKQLSLLCAILLLTSAMLTGLAAEDYDYQPVMQAFSKTSPSNGEIQFTLGDFQTDYTLMGIVIATLPDSSCGTLKFGTRDLLAGEAVPAAAIDSIRFVPSTVKAAGTHFNIMPVYEEDLPFENVTVAINLLGKENRPPIAEEFDIKTCKNVAITAGFRGSDPDNDPLTYKIVGKPKRGEVEVLGDGTFKYKPYEKKTGKDSMTYIATDAYGNVSNEAKISIRIEKSPTKLTYADMNDSPALYHALKLAGKGVYVGEKLGDSHYFNPNAEMSRGEFMVMLMTALGLDPSGSTSRTGFADDAEIPEWMRPYATLALKNGIVNGENTADGRKALMAMRDITRAEAAVLINNAGSIENAGVMPVFADTGEMPAWAAQAVSNLDAVGIMNAYPDGSIRLGETITREQAAILVYNAVEYQEQSKKGLLSRAFG
ncbi:MAG: S-layer homology domain-containing protein [Oscillospiraceae bacterium]|nr:S-layer homology domain-containing protein [Oscillospiraceae bacterium]